ncbi:MAG: tRNA (N(6)-L-threonylcarbamoyladenosine(37)-C(2))-methylthiotransferase MtaB [Verrucomicrobiota bacterium]
MMKLAIKTLGCRLNQAESATLSGIMRDRGWDIVPFGDQADAVLVHSCTITEKALKKTIRFCRSSKKKNPGAPVILAGCAVQVAGASLRAESRADILLDQSDKWNIAEAIINNISQNTSINAPLTRATKSLPAPEFTTTRAPIKVQDGCDFHCSYCIVPKTRGRSLSRNPEEIIEEIDNLCRNGFKEVILTGANLGCYLHNKTGLVELLEKIENSTGIQRIRLSSIEPTTAEDDVIEFMATSRKLCRSLHVPLQSGDNRILKKMGRRYTREQYITFIRLAVNTVENLGMGTDIIAGFPTETGSEFQNTLKLVDEAPFSNIHAFSYSKRPGTAAASLPDKPGGSEISKRVDLLREKHEQKRQIFAETLIGKDCRVLIEKIESGFAKGWTSEYLPAIFPAGNAKINDIITFRPHTAEKGTLKGGPDKNSF